MSMITFSYGFFGMFMIITVFIAYFLTGNFNLPYYKFLSFLFLKVVQTCLRGSIDNIDFDDTLDLESVDINAFDFKSIISNSETSYFSVINNLTLVGYFIVRIFNL